jgi:hypothetical protein
MVAGARFNDKTPFLLVKVMLAAAMMTWLTNKNWLLEILFHMLHRFFRNSLVIARMGIPS